MAKHIIVHQKLYQLLICKNKKTTKLQCRVNTTNQQKDWRTLFIENTTKKILKSNNNNKVYAILIKEWILFKQRHTQWNAKEMHY